MGIRASHFEVVLAESERQIAAAARLFQEYAESLGFSLDFQHFDEELQNLPGVYAPPLGRLFLAQIGEEFVGCAALRPLDRYLCELKRLYVQPAFRGAGVGGVLMGAVLDAARTLGYRKLRLDTIEPMMQEAIAMYREMGFHEIAPYRENPIPGALYLELDLAPNS